MNSGRRHRLGLRHASLLALSLACAGSLAAQSSGQPAFAISYADSAPDWVWRMPQPTGCLAAIPDSLMHNVPVYLSADMAPVIDKTLTPQAELMAHDVAAELRSLIDSSHSAMPNADGKLRWYSVPAQIVVIARADGIASWKAKGTGGDSTAAMLLGAAFDSAQANGLARMFWPEGVHADSFVVRLALMPRYTGFIERNGPEVQREVKFGVFYLTEPEATPALPKGGQPPPVYPRENESRRIQGEVLMQLVVDSTGRAEPATIRDLWPDDSPRLQGYMAEYYNAFVLSVRNWEKQLHFEPMRVGGCPVRQLVQQPLKFVAPGAQ